MNIFSFSSLNIFIIATLIHLSHKLNIWTMFRFDFYWLYYFDYGSHFPLLCIASNFYWILDIVHVTRFFCFPLKSDDLCSSSNINYWPTILYYNFVFYFIRLIFGKCKIFPKPLNWGDSTSLICRRCQDLVLSYCAGI